MRMEILKGKKAIEENSIIQKKAIEENSIIQKKVIEKINGTKEKGRSNCTFIL